MSTVTSTLTDENVADIIEIAAYGGITYWAEQPTKADFESAPEGTAATIREQEDGKVHYLTAQKIREAYEALLQVDQPYVNRRIHGYILQSWVDRGDLDGIDASHIDADAADVIIQVAAFGDVVYG
ncbi:hypothetical protein AB0D08_00555 [Kitasatospora sp. NPDC048540]|uniref:hypothetical protein n=1 Tax=Kitasatospora sp. NPDC048540 TaxID=3155634 RepID=UPI00340FED39